MAYITICPMPTQSDRSRFETNATESANDFVRAAFEGDFQRAAALSQDRAHLGIHRDAAYITFMQCAAFDDLRPARAMLEHPNLARQQAQAIMRHERHAIEACCKSNDAKTLRGLCELGFPIDAALTYHGLMALHYAARYDALECLNTLSAYGARIDAADKTGNTALHLASSRFNPLAVAGLLALGADPDKANLRMERPLHTAAEYGQLAVARLLIAHGADHSAFDIDGRTPAQVAQTTFFGQHSELAQWLDSYAKSTSERQAIESSTNPANDACGPARARM